VTPHGVDCSYFSKRASKEEIDNINRKFKLDKPYKILFLGHLNQNKRPDILIKAFSLLKDKKKDVQLVIRSRWGDYYKETLRLIRYFEVQDMVKLITQPVYGPEFRALYQTSYAFINTYTNLTGYSTALLEAMASGVPPIISKGSNEDVVDESTGIILKNLSPISVANSIRSLMEDEKYANKLGQNAVRKMSTTFDWDNVVVPKYVSVYKELLEQ
jgi:glycosyltransferase involved in cell wall biosynthesis